MPERVPFREALRVWWRIGLLSFGGPAGQIALMHRILVDEKKWIGEKRFLHALNFCMLLPGPEAQQLATYVGWLLHGVRGGLAAGLLFILPGALLLILLSWVYVLAGDVPMVDGLFFGLKAAVLALVMEALLRIAKRALKTRFDRGLATLAFLAIFVFALPFPLVVGGAAMLGVLGVRFRPSPAAVEEVDPDVVERPGTLRAALACLLLWLGTLGSLWAALGADHVYARISVFFSKLALVTFGGAYAVLAYMAQQAVENYHWLEAGEMLDGLGLAETTPGPLILVTQFVGFLAAYRHASPPLLAGTLGALLTLWVTFLPCFVWIFAGAPFVEKLRGRRGLSAALSAVTAAVVGVIANLSLWFAFHFLFARHVDVSFGGFGLKLPVLASADNGAFAISALAMLLVFRWHKGVFATLGLSAMAGMLWRFAGA